MGGVSITSAVYDGVYRPVTFVSRTINLNEINYGMVDKDVLAPLTNLVCLLRYAGIPRDQGSHSILNPCFIGPIFGSLWEAGELGRPVAEL